MTDSWWSGIKMYKHNLGRPSAQFWPSKLWQTTIQNPSVSFLSMLLLPLQQCQYLDLDLPHHLTALDQRSVSNRQFETNEDRKLKWVKVNFSVFANLCCFGKKFNASNAPHFSYLMLLNWLMLIVGSLYLLAQKMVYFFKYSYFKNIFCY